MCFVLKLKLFYNVMLDIYIDTSITFCIVLEINIGQTVIEVSIRYELGVMETSTTSLHGYKHTQTV